MKQFFKVFKFEYGNYAKNKVFIGVTLALLIIITGVLFFPRIKEAANLSMPGEGSAEAKTIAVIDKTEKGGVSEFLSAGMAGYTVEKADGDLESAKSLVSDGKYDFVILVESPLKYSYVVENKSLYDATTTVIDELLLAKYRVEYMADLGLNEEQISSLTLSAVESETVIVGKDQTQSFFYTYILMFLLYMTVLMYGQFVAQSVAMEKSSRAMELLITSANPRNLIFGKVLGVGFAGLSQIIALLVWSFVCFRINKPYWDGNMVINAIFDMPPALIAYTVIFFILGFLIYAFLYGALGSLASKTEEIGTLTMPVTFFMVLAFLGTMLSMSTDKMDTVFVKVLSYIPFCSPMAMFARIAMNTATTLEAVISIIVLIISNILIGYLAVAIYRIGILMYGKPPKLRELVRELRKK